MSKEDSSLNSAVGVKYDDGKLRFDLLPPRALEQVVRVYTFGAKKYADRNWEKGIKYSRVFAALCRHVFAYLRGERFDPESGLHPLAHAAWCCLALLHFAIYSQQYATAYDDLDNIHDLSMWPSAWSRHDPNNPEISTAIKGGHNED